MITDDILTGCRLAIDAMSEAPETVRETGALRSCWDVAMSHAGLVTPMSEHLDVFDRAVQLTPREASEVILLTCHAQNAGARQARANVQGAVVNALAVLAGEGAYQHIQGIWIAMRWAGIEIDHGAVVAQLEQTHDPSVAATYAHEASVGAAILHGGGPVSLPASASTH